jgi:hypothetical protein
VAHRSAEHWCRSDPVLKELEHLRRSPGLDVTVMVSFGNGNVCRIISPDAISDEQPNDEANND